LEENTKAPNDLNYGDIRARKVLHLNQYL